MPDPDPKQPSNPTDAESRRHMIRTFGLFGVIVSYLIGASAAGIALGYAVQKYLGFPSWTMVITLMLGLALGFYRVYQISKKEWGT